MNENQAVQFNYRVVGIVIHNGRVLAHRGEDEGFWTLPGGHAELLEPAALTLKRELREELGIEVEVDRLVWSSRTSSHGTRDGGTKSPSIFSCSFRQPHQLSPGAKGSAEVRQPRSCAFAGSTSTSSWTWNCILGSCAVSSERSRPQPRTLSGLVQSRKRLCRNLDPAASAGLIPWSIGSTEGYVGLG